MPARSPSRPPTEVGCETGRAGDFRTRAQSNVRPLEASRSRQTPTFHRPAKPSEVDRAVTPTGTSGCARSRHSTTWTAQQSPPMSPTTVDDTAAGTDAARALPAHTNHWFKAGQDHLGMAARPPSDEPLRVLISTGLIRFVFPGAPQHYRKEEREGNALIRRCLRQFAASAAEHGSRDSTGACGHGRWRNRCCSPGSRS